MTATNFFDISKLSGCTETDNGFYISGTLFYEIIKDIWE